ncbi:Uncharacterised protein [Corynebacterium ulcerans]|nr:Uncharacterised protein [Corynebacterium ulcerans]
MLPRAISEIPPRPSPHQLKHRQGRQQQIQQGMRIPPRTFLTTDDAPMPPKPLRHRAPDSLSSHRVTVCSVSAAVLTEHFAQRSAQGLLSTCSWRLLCMGSSHQSLPVLWQPLLAMARPDRREFSSRRCDFLDRENAVRRIYHGTSSLNRGSS